VIVASLGRSSGRRHSIWWVCLLGLVFGVPARPASRPSFYFSTHPDDWQLFMNPNAYNDTRKETAKVVFVYVTAGDGGNGAGPAGSQSSYSGARENGARMSLRFIADGNNTPTASSSTTVSVNGHSIAKYIYRNTVSYFLRLYDGSMTGGGYASTGWQSLQLLEAGEIATLSAIDGSATYHGWSDLVSTIAAIIREEGGACGASLNLPDPDVWQNPGDHPDHLATGRLVVAATAGSALFSRRYFVGYNSGARLDNLGKDEAQIEAVTFGQVIAALNAAGYAAPWDDSHRSWLGKSYSRFDPGTPVDCGAPDARRAVPFPGAPRSGASPCERSCF
jgi:hypothetical protein